ncbi:unnamed protein product [Lactuca saligna]|uniref:FAD-binding oxidoreductase/transferase type 4 C-terminal domain-containing protein n=1 Tax=Lactuca saligna TaxID=75948 RepID=A0AA35ZEN3_LACSI|nr:unnamed protein product [Lactuca saligna]
MIQSPEAIVQGSRTCCQDYISCQKLLFQARLGEILYAFEFVDHLDSVQTPLASSIYNFYVLIETTGSNESNDRENVEGFLVDAMKSGLISDGAISKDLNQALSFWRIREGIPEALQKAGVVYEYDLSIPKRKTTGKANIVGYGHLGDGNLHLNMSDPQHIREDAGDGKGTTKDLLDKIASLESEAEKSFMHSFTLEISHIYIHVHEEIYLTIIMCDPIPLIFALAVRIMGFIQVDKITDYL